jgi:CheY-like chemotaxis protein
MISLASVAQHKISIEEFSLREVCNAIVLELNKNIGDKNIVRVWTETTIPDWYRGQSTEVAYPIKMVSAFMALNLSNGIISIELKEWSKKGNEVSIHVNITGSGIPESNISPQRKTEEQLEEDFHAIGLASNNVSFSVRNEKLNAKFKVVLHMGGKSNPTSSMFSDKKILIVEDNEVNALVFSSFMEDWGINVELAYNGEDGVELAWANEYSAVIMDIYMPGLNGIDATKRIREFNTKVPIIALSASTLPNDMKDAFDAGVNEYLSKPIASDRLLNTLTKLL